MFTREFKNGLAILLVFLMLFLIAGEKCEKYNATHKHGYRHDEGVLLGGTLIDYKYWVANRYSTAVTLVDNKLQPVSTWTVSYIDKNGKFGSCRFYTTGYERMSGNDGKYIECPTTKLLFN